MLRYISAYLEIIQLSSLNIFSFQILKKHEYFGKYGKIHKVVINPSTAYAGVQVCIIVKFSAKIYIIDLFVFMDILQ